MVKKVEGIKEDGDGEGARCAGDPSSPLSSNSFPPPSLSAFIFPTLQIDVEGRARKTVTAMTRVRGLSALTTHLLLHYFRTHLLLLHCPCSSSSLCRSTSSTSSESLFHAKIISFPDLSSSPDQQIDVLVEKLYSRSGCRCGRSEAWGRNFCDGYHERWGW